MAGPWEKYAAQEASGPWQNYAAEEPSFLDKAQQLLRQGVETATFGLVGDEANAWFQNLTGQGDSYESELARERANEVQMREDHPYLSLGADVAGAVAPALMGLGVLSGAGSTGGAVMRGIGAGIGAGGLQGFMEGEGDGRLPNAAMGAGVGGVLGGAVPAATAGISRVVNNAWANRAIRQASRGAPSTADLRAMGNAAYRAIDDAGVQISPDAVRSAGADIIDAMTRQGLDAGPMSLTPQSARLAEVIAGAVPDGATGVPFSAIEVMRRKAGVPASNIGNRVESALGSRVIEGLDDFVNNLQPAQVVAGKADDLASNIATARDIWSRMSRSQLIEDAIENSQNYMGGEASGIRNQFSRILKNPKLSRGFSDVEKRAMRRVVSGSIPEQILQLAGGGLGQMATIGGGAAAGGAPGALAGMAAAGGARRLSEALTRRNAETVRALIASGGIAQAPQISPVVQALLNASGFGAVPSMSTSLAEKLHH